MINMHCLVEVFEGAGIVVGGSAAIILSIIGLAKLAEEGYEKNSDYHRSNTLW